jgi:hypothetical protein
MFILGDGETWLVSLTLYSEISVSVLGLYVLLRRGLKLSKEIIESDYG